MSTETKGRRCPQLPFEIWTRIISYLSTDTHFTANTWINFRQASHMLRAATEDIYATIHLNKTTIQYDLGMVRDNEGMKCYMSLDLAFSRLSDDRLRAIFVDEHPEDVPSQRRRGIYNVMQSRWDEKMDMYLGTSCGNGERRFDLPPHTITLRRYANDTDLPGLEVDYAKREISFEWKGMFNAFFDEEVYVKKLLKKNDKSGNANAAALGELVKTGEIGLKDAFTAVAKRDMANEAKARRRARRERARNWYKKHQDYDLPKGWFEMDFDEKEKLKDLERTRSALSWGEISDEEEFERDQSEDENSDDELEEGQDESEEEDEEEDDIHGAWGKVYFDDDADIKGSDLSSEDEEFERSWREMLGFSGD